MKKRKTDIILIIIIMAIYFSSVFTADYRGANTGRMVSGIFILASLVLSWILLKNSTIIMKIFGYFMHLGLMFMASSVVIQFIIGPVAGAYSNLVLLIIILAGYYFLMYRKLN
jgi:hypothetical protein